MDVSLVGFFFGKGVRAFFPLEGQNLLCLQSAVAFGVFVAVQPVHSTR